MLLLAFSNGCVSYVSRRADGTVVRRHFGYVEVATPPQASTSGDVSVMEITSAGMRIQHGIGLGFFKERIETIPLDSRLVIRVQNQAQLDQVIRILGPITKEGLCVVVDPTH